MSTLGPLVAADEALHHQITDTFATVSQSDRSWTEKVCAMAAPRDGTIQLAFGLGRYPNRGVLDAYAGVSRGVEQWTVRASRRLTSDLERTHVGPIRYEVLEPLRSVRFSLAPNDVLPISFEWTFTGAVPPALEQREHHRSRDGLRLDADIVRYHHIGTASGWVDVDGERTELDDVVGRVDTRPLVGRPLHGRRSGDRHRGPGSTEQRRYHRDVVADPLRAARRQPLRTALVLPAPRPRRLGAARAAGRRRAPGRTP